LFAIKFKLKLNGFISLTGFGNFRNQQNIKIMSKSLVVNHSIKIDATPSRVWEVLTKPEYIRQWDLLPEDFGDYEIHPATIIERPGQRSLNVVEFDLNKRLSYQLEVPEWKEQGVSHIGYNYSLTIDAEGHTWLGIEIGDFAILTESDKFYDESSNFGLTASHKIKELAEQNNNAL
jgi:hypothetical protein